MDVLKPDILVVDGIRYRNNTGQYGNYGGVSYEQIEDLYYDNYDDTPACEVSDGEEDIEEIEGGRFKASFHVAKSYFPYIIGSKGATRKRLETETRSKILIPKQGHDGDIVITAATKKNVASARRRIRMMVLSSRKRSAPTHFLSIPLNKANIQSGFVNFKEEVLLKCGTDIGISEKLFQNPEHLHLTIGVLALSDEFERQEAASALEECKENIISPLMMSKKLKIEMSGIEIMNDDPSRVNVLYGKVVAVGDDELLQNLVDGINTFFSQKGLLTKERSKVKLHCTLMNSHFLKSNEEEVDNSSPSLKEIFDATNILNDFKDYYFGEEIISTLELSMLHTSSSNQYYKASSFITIP